jgi:hypothetical protein
MIRIYFFDGKFIFIFGWRGGGDGRAMWIMGYFAVGVEVMELGGSGFWKWAG